MSVAGPGAEGGGWKLGRVLGKGLFVAGAAALLALQYASYLRQEAALRKADEALVAAMRAAERPAPLPFVVPRAAGPTGDEIRSIVREELRSQGQKAAAAGEQARPSPPAPATPELTNESLDALAGATRLVERAVAAGRWDDSNVAEMRRIASNLNTEQMESVARQLSVAINQQKVRIAVTGPLF